MRPQRAAMASSWVTSSKVVPCLGVEAREISPMTAGRWPRLRSPVGSSASTSLGSGEGAGQRDALLLATGEVLG